ncbi:MAG: hypothetical protein IJ042_05325 [Butyricicoccus sp.]|nr:hypothetical protein [Butyricicoccus sp.]
MKDEIWFKALDALDDELLEEAGVLLTAQKPHRRKIAVRRWLTVAALICLLFSLCGNVFAVAWVQEREEQLAEQEDFYLRYLTESTQDLRQDEFDAERFFAALESTDTETVYIAINRLVECYNDPALRERAIGAITPFLESRSEMVAASAERVLSVLRGTFDADGVCRLADGGALFTLYPGLDGGSDSTLWRIQGGVLAKWWSMEDPYQYVTELVLSPDGQKAAVCLVSGKSGFLIVIDFETGKVSGELVNTILAQVRAGKGMRAHVRADFETYSSIDRVRWIDAETLAFVADMYFAPEGETETVSVVYHTKTLYLEIQ